MDVTAWNTCLYAFGTTVTFAIILQSHKRYLWIQGCIGMLAWIIYILLKQQLDFSSFAAIFIASFTATFICEICARIFKEPTIILIVPAHFPLVPGLGLYLGMSKILENNYTEGLSILLTAATDAGGIALGIMMMTSLFRIFKRK